MSYPANSPAAKPRLARLDMSAGDKPGAVRTIDEVVAAHPTNIEALVSRAGVLAEEGKHDGALEVLKKALAVDARSPSVHFALGKLHLLRRDTTAALGAFGQVVKVHPRNSAAQFELARLHFNSGRLEDANVIQSAVQLAPADFEARLLCARINRMKGNTAARSTLKLLAAALPVRPLSRRSRLSSARSQQRGGGTILPKVIDKAPGFSEAAVALAVMDAQEKRPDSCGAAGCAPTKPHRRAAVAPRRRDAYILAGIRCR